MKREIVANRARAICSGCKQNAFACKCSSEESEAATVILMPEEKTVIDEVRTAASHITNALRLEAKGARRNQLGVQLAAWELEMGQLIKKAETFNGH